MLSKLHMHFQNELFELKFVCVRETEKGEHIRIPFHQFCSWSNFKYKSNLKKNTIYSSLDHIGRRICDSSTLGV